MSNNNKFSLNIGYVQLNIIKHALEYYMTREATQQEKEKENRLLERVNEKISFVKMKYHF